MADKKLIDLELLKQYRGKSLAEIQRLIAEAQEVSISETAPTNSGAKIWIDTSMSGEVNIPEIKDDTTSSVDTWSSIKINSFVGTTVESTINETISDSIVTTDDIDNIFTEVSV